MEKKINIYVSDFHQENLQFFAYFYRLTGEFTYITLDQHLDAHRMYLSIEEEVDFDTRKSRFHKNLKNVEHGDLIDLQNIGNQQIYNSIYQFGFSNSFYIVNRSEDFYIDDNNDWNIDRYTQREDMQYKLIKVESDIFSMEKALVDTLIHFEDYQLQDVVLDIDLDFFYDFNELNCSIFFVNLLIDKCKYITLTKSNETATGWGELFHSEECSSEDKYNKFLSLLEDNGYSPRVIKIEDIY